MHAGADSIGIFVVNDKVLSPVVGKARVALTGVTGAQSAKGKSVCTAIG